MKFCKDGDWLDAPLRDADGEKVEFSVRRKKATFTSSYTLLVCVNDRTMVGLTRAQARKLAKRILKETE